MTPPPPIPGSSVCVIETYDSNHAADSFGPALVPGNPPGATLTVLAQAGHSEIQVYAFQPGKGSASLQVFRNCNRDTEMSAPTPVLPSTPAGETTTVHLASQLRKGSTLCVIETYTDPLPYDLSGKITIGHEYDSLCRYAFNDCDWRYTALAGFEQSDLSGQNSQTDPFIDLIVRTGSVWLRARFLGVPGTSNTQNIVAVAANPSGAASTTTLANIANSIDYLVGYQYDLFQPKRNNPGRGQFTLGFIGAFGATTPVAGLANTQGFAVPAFGTNECNELHTRLSNAAVYTTPLPASGPVTTTTTVGSATPVMVMQNYCVVQPTADGKPITTTTTAGGVTTVVTMTGTPQTNIAFSPQDRSSFLLKYIAGVRLITRFHSGSSGRCSPRAANDQSDGSLVNGPCTRDIVDFTVGQDQAITGGVFHSVVFKADAILPIKQTGITLFLSASIRAQHNVNLDPLILTPTPISTGSGSVAGAVTLPSPSVFVLPLLQSNRDFYRIGLALDLEKILPKLFQSPDSK